MSTAGNRRWWALGAMALAMLSVGLDGTILSVALPTLAVRLHASTVELQWFVAAYTLVIAVAVLPGGLLGDRFGRKKMLMTGLAVFGIGSVWCAYSSTAGQFIAARVVAGVGAAICIPLSLSTLTVLFSERERPRAVGIWSSATFLALPVGPILGGWLLSRYWSGWVFLINVPVVVLGLVALALAVPESLSARRPALDPVGVLASCAGLGLLTFGVIEAGQRGWSDGVALSEIAGGLLLLAGFGLWELRLGRRTGGQPLIDTALFRGRGFTWGTILAAMSGFAMIGVLFTVPQFFQAILGTDAMGSGLRLLPMIGGTIIGAGGADRIAARIGVRSTAAAGFTLLAAGLFLGAATSTTSGFGFVAAWIAVIGAGLGLTFATTTSAALSELSAERSGVGSAVMQSVQKVGAPLGSAVLGSVVNSAYRDHLHLAGLPGDLAGTVRDSVFAAQGVAGRLGSAGLLAQVRAAFTHGVDVMLVVCAVAMAVAVVLALLLLPGRGRHESTAPAAGPAEGPAERRPERVG
ncbi:MFS transporter [Rugosimonospora africana]|nr:MFS transporter [Rugosimonospora africana]